MTFEIVKFVPTNEANHDNPAISIAVTFDQFHVDCIDVAGETISSLKCQSFAHALMHVAMLLIYSPTVDYTVEEH